MSISGIPPEIVDSIIDKLQHDRKSLLQASLTCKILCQRTRVHLFSSASLSHRYDCYRLMELITLSPHLALHFKSLKISYIYPPSYIPTSTEYRALSVIESLSNVTHLTLAGGDWCYMPDSIVSNLQSRSYRSLIIGLHFSFRSIGEICSLVKNSPRLQEARISCSNTEITEECNLDHSLHITPAPVTIYVDGSQDYSSSAGTILNSVLSSRPCILSCSNIVTLEITLRDANTAVPQCLNRYLVQEHDPFKSLHVRHIRQGFRTAISETLHVSNVEKIAVTVLQMPVPIDRTTHILEWWISNLAAVNDHCIIRSFSFTVIALPQEVKEGHPSLNWEDLWRRLDSCLTSSKMASLERVAITFEPRPAEWDAFKTRMEGNFLGLKRLGRELSLNVVGQPMFAWDQRIHSNQNIIDLDL
ncbi:hypothetical protein EDD18DRAFT_872540 [Armillaria luteobubalina]|uniref:F-box domain-containing protein n=1 Tax=Armillaria luteobubalina TaxID=153913 RepID=A0AA39P780_9AGAR|nr:hypothetical protein EDD18DRAFT_872540 [Armillaria luteobubalina]